MGDYTRIKFRAKLREDTPANVLAVFDAASRGEADNLESLPDADFFKDERWTMVFNGASAYFQTPEKCQVAVEDGLASVSFHSSVKNYDDVIEKFFDWISPYLAETPGGILGEYEWTSDQPETVIVGADGKITRQKRQPELDDSETDIW
ncbi:hypothetical protein HA052_04145 [Chromobacterium haemolyticum]|uniref:Uncharacterized protein n=1 Tax=Chromobacterium fluminis TaxID=3044269 RepID=A0ABX0KZZ0_9NEIS|nr:hypothetical protein [Chromobacterium haemolyticum]NHR04381.1 hypothetical protein [Chromobacterium haemolyticum]